MAKTLADRQVDPTHVSIAGLAIVTAGAVTTLLLPPLGYIGLAVIAVGCLADAVDGELARAAGGGSTSGRFIDSLVDRMVETETYFTLAYCAYEVTKQIVLPFLFGGLGVLSYLCSYVAMWASDRDPRAASGPIHRGGRLAIGILAGAAAFIWIPLAIALLSVGLAASAWTLRTRTLTVLRSGET